MSTFVPLENLAQVSLGYKSLQNDFFYVNEATVDSYTIEPKYLQPINMLGSLDGTKYHQTSKNNTWIFICRAKKLI